LFVYYSLFKEIVVLIRAILIISHHFLSLFEHILMEDDCQYGPSERKESIDPHVLEIGSTIIEHHSKAGAQTYSWIQNSSALRHSSSIEHSTSTDVRGGNDETVNSLLLREKSLLFGLSKEKEGNKEGAKSLGNQSSKYEPSM
jgi:hypothetical protein